MLDGMTVAQLLEWQEFAREEPFGFHPQAELASLLASVVANSAAFRTGDPIPPSRFRWTPGRAKEVDPAVDFADALGGSVPAGPDLSRPLPD